MHVICFVNLPRSAIARLRKVSLQLPYLSVFPLTKRVFRDALKSVSSSSAEQKQTARTWFQSIILLYDCGKSVNSTSHIRISAHQVYLRKSYLFQHYRIPRKIAVMVSADAFSGSSTVIPVPMIFMQVALCICVVAGNGDNGTIACFSEHSSTDSRIFCNLECIALH